MCEKKDAAFFRSPSSSSATRLLATPSGGCLPSNRCWTVTGSGRKTIRASGSATTTGGPSSCTSRPSTSVSNANCSAIRRRGTTSCGGGRVKGAVCKRVGGRGMQQASLAASVGQQGGTTARRWRELLVLVQSGCCAQQGGSRRWKRNNLH